MQGLIILHPIHQKRSAFISLALKGQGFTGGSDKNTPEYSMNSLSAKYASEF